VRARGQKILMIAIRRRDLGGGVDDTVTIANNASVCVDPLSRY